MLEPDKKIYFSRSTSASTMDISPIELRNTGTTRLIFKPIWAHESENPLRGGFVFQRKSINDTWEDIPAKTLPQLKKDEEYRLALQPEEVIKLISEFDSIRKVYSEHGHVSGHSAITLTEHNADGVFLQISNTANRELIVKSLKELEEGNFENLDRVLNFAKIDKAIDIFEANMDNNDENFWQSFFQEHAWILQQVFSYPVLCLQGETYVGGKNTNGRGGQGGVATDFLFKDNSNGCFLVAEIKTPLTKLITDGVYRGGAGSELRNEVYNIKTELSGGIIQLENQIYTAVENFKTQIGEDFSELNLINPKGALIIGNKTILNPEQQKTLNLFRKALGKNIVYTFDGRYPKSLTLFPCVPTIRTYEKIV